MTRIRVGGAIGIRAPGSLDYFLVRRMDGIDRILGKNRDVVFVLRAASSPLVVTVYDQNGAPLPGVIVAWSIVTGTGSLSFATSTTDASGQASVEFIAGAPAGDVVVDAIVSGLDAVPFDVTVVSSF
jgi:hypothetical protein